MKLRFVFALFLLLGGSSGTLLTVEFQRRMQADADSRFRPSPVETAVAPVRTGLVVPSSPIVRDAAFIAGLIGVTVLCLALLLLLPRLLREERRAAVLQAGLPPLPSAASPPPETPSLSTPVASNPVAAMQAVFCVPPPCKTINWTANISKDAPVAFDAAWRADRTLPDDLRTNASRLPSELARRADFNAPLSLLACDDHERWLGMTLVFGALEQDPTVFCWVHPAHRRQGVGRELLQRLELEARKAAVNRLITANPTANDGLSELAVRDESGAAFLLVQGWRVYVRVRRVVSDLSAVRLPDELRARMLRLRDEGFRFGPVFAGGSVEFGGLGDAVFGGQTASSVEAQAAECFQACGLCEADARVAAFRAAARADWAHGVWRNDKLVGIVLIDPPDASGCAGLNRLVVRPECRERGVGRLLLYSAFDLWRATKARRVEIFTDPRSAESFFVPAGFEAADERLAMEKKISSS
jgi:GNAT superfamily N-acetyltransferase